MKANELRIGNKVRVCFQDVEGWEEVQVTAIYSDNTIDTTANATTKYYYEPIPLTPEILQRFGFVLNPEYEHPGFDEYIHSEKAGWGIGDYNGEHYLLYFLDQHFSLDAPGILYLHQLQNIWFFITGTELGISHNNK